MSREKRSRHLCQIEIGEIILSCYKIDKCILISFVKKLFFVVNLLLIILNYIILSSRNKNGSILDISWKEIFYFWDIILNWHSTRLSEILSSVLVSVHWWKIIYYLEYYINTKKRYKIDADLIGYKRNFTLCNYDKK